MSEVSEQSVRAFEEFRAKFITEHGVEPTRHHVWETAVRATKERLLAPMACRHPRACLVVRKWQEDVTYPVTREMAIDDGDLSLEGTPYAIGQTWEAEECSACEHEKQAVAQAVAETIDRCRDWLTSRDRPSLMNPETLQHLAQNLLQFCSSDPHWLERKLLEERLAEAEWWSGPNPTGAEAHKRKEELLAKLAALAKDKEVTQ